MKSQPFDKFDKGTIRVQCDWEKELAVVTLWTGRSLLVPLSMATDPLVRRAFHPEKRFNSVEFIEPE